MVRGGEAVTWVTAYRLVSANFSVVLDISFGVLAPDDRVIFVRFEELRNVISSPFNSIEPFLAEYTRHILLDGGDGGGAKSIPEEPE